MSVVGLDFGNKNVVIAAAGRGGVDVILNGNSNRLNPCMSAFNGASRACGEDASSTATSNYANTITSMKRLIGLQFSDPRTKAELELCPFKAVENVKNGGVSIEVSYEGETKVVPVELATGMMVSHMSSIARDNNKGQAVQDWVISVPPYYTDQQKRGFLDACEVVGVDCLKLMNETTASALAYGIFKDMKKEFKQDGETYTMFIDLGATSYAASIVSFTKQKLTVLSTHWDKDLGGRDFDRAIANWAASAFVEKYKNAGDPRNKPKALIKLLAASEKAKKTLSPAGVTEARMNIECLMEEYDFNGALKKDNFEEMCSSLLDRLEGPIMRCIEESKVPMEQLSSIELIGGGTRVDCVKRKLSEIFKLDSKKQNYGLSTTMNADEAVARGCALQSAILSPRFKVLPYEIIESSLHPVKISWEGEGAENEDGEEGGETENEVVMFDRGSNFGVTKRVTLKKSGQFVVKAAYAPIDASSNTLDPNAPTDIATFKIDAPQSADPVKIRVNIKQDVSGIITLSSAQAVEEIPQEEEEVKEAEKEGEEGETKEGEAPKEGEEVKEAPKKKYKKTLLNFVTDTFMTLSKQDMNETVELEARMANADRIAKETAAMRNELESYLYSMRDKMIGELKDYATESEATTFSKALESTEDWLYSDEGFDTTKSVYSDKLNEVKKFGAPIEKREVEASTRQKSINSFKGSLELYKGFVQSNDEKYAHIGDDEKDTCRAAISEAETWLYDMIEKQASVAQNVDPVLTVAMLAEKQKEMTGKVTPIMHKPKPAPVKEETKKDETKEGEEAKGDGEAKEGGEETPMETEEATPPEPPADGPANMDVD